MLSATKPSSTISNRLPFHVLVSAEVFNDREAQALIKAMGLVVEDEDHMAKWLAGASGLIH